jgi:uncharacterized protein
MIDEVKNFEGLNITFNTNEDCNLACKYDLLEGTKVLMADLSEKNTEDVKKGDIIVGFDEEHPLHKFRKLHYAVVEDCGLTRVMNSFYKYKTSSRELSASAEHPVLNQKNVFKTTEDFFRSKTKNKKVYTVSIPDRYRKNKETIENKSFYKRCDVVIRKAHSKEPKRFFNLTTSTRTFIANGILVHNCYEIDKKHRVLSLDYAKKFIDVILTDPDPIGCSGTEEEWMLDRGLILDFIGGDSFMHVDLVDKILSYYVYKVNTFPNHKWANNWRVAISSNGTLFEKKECRDFVKKWRSVLSLGISVDGCPTIHDKNRIFAEKGPNGEEVGSMQSILKWWPWLKENHPKACDHTKATCSKESIPYIYESLKYMHEDMGMTYIFQNFIMEANGCTEKDYDILREQLDKCIDYVLEHRHDLHWTMLGKRFMNRLNPYELDKCFCGSGAMPALSIDGKIYPCFRWLPHSQEDRERSERYCVGDIWNGLNHKERFREIREAITLRISPPECLECEYSPCCCYCVAGCYSEFGCFKRTTYICELTKIIAKAAEKYWNKYFEIEGSRDYYKPGDKNGT